MIYIKLLSWIWPILGNIYLDRDGKKPNYLAVNIIRGIFAILHGAWILPQDINYYELGWIGPLKLWLPILIFEVTSYWIFFELGLNIVRKNPLLYYDHQEGDSGYIDRFFKWAGPVWHGIAKALAFIIMIWSITYIIKNYD